MARRVDWGGRYDDAAILLLGLLTRQKRGVGNIGWEGAAMIVTFLGGHAVLHLL